MDKIKYEKDKVSVVITTRNRSNSLNKAIKSVLNQTYKNIELIVVDDGSTDDTKILCQSYTNVIYIFISSKNHKNGNYARNLGIKNSTGEFIAFLDDDDEWLDTKIEKQINKIKTDPNIGVVFVGSKIIVNNGALIYDNRIHTEFKEDCSKKSLYTIGITSSAILCRKDILYKVGLFDENLNYWQETELIIRISQISTIDYVDEILINYAIDLKDKSRLTNNIDGFVEAVQYINNKHKDKIINLNEEEKKYREILINGDIANRYTALGMNKEAREYLLKNFKLKPNLKNLLKVILVITNNRKLKFKLIFYK